jgi:hypothetical protein
MFFRVFVFEIFLALSFFGAMLSPRFGDLPCGHSYICKRDAKIQSESKTVEKAAKKGESRRFWWLAGIKIQPKCVE